MKEGAPMHNKTRPPRVACINDLSGYGRCSLTTAVAVLSAMGVQACPAPTAILSKHTGFPHFTFQDFTPHLGAYLADWGELEFDAVYTGDLGAVGSLLLAQLLERDGLVLHNHQDCGLLVFDRATQDVQAGGSGAGCSASVLCCHVLPRLEAGKLRRVLFLSTGALMSQTTFLQGESIPGVAHLVELRCAKEEAE